MDKYMSKYELSSDVLTMHEVEHIFQLSPEPPKLDSLNDYILAELREKDNRNFLFFLHHYEVRMNHRVRCFLLREGLDRYDPERFLDYKIAFVRVLLECLKKYSPDKGADFLTYAHHFLRNALIQWRMKEEAGDFGSLSEYKTVRNIAWMYGDSQKSEEEVIAEYAKKTGLSEETVAEHLAVAKLNRSRVPLYVTAGEEESEETGEDVTCDDRWNYADILWNGIRAKAVRSAFRKLGYRDQILLEKRNAICMTCGRVSPLSTRTSFEDLAILFEGTGADGAEIAYRRAVEKLTLLLVEDGIIHALRLKRKSMMKRKKKIAAATYLYQADCDGEWGEIFLDFANGTAEIVKLADLDTTVSHIFANRATAYLLKCANEKLPKETMVAFER